MIDEEIKEVEEITPELTPEQEKKLGITIEEQEKISGHLRSHQRKEPEPDPIKLERLSITHEEMELIKFEVLKTYRDELRITKERLQDELILASQQIFEKAEFISAFKKKIYAFIEAEIKTQISDSDMHAVIKSKIDSYSQDKLREITTTILDAILKGLNKKLTMDLELTKKLAFSVDSEINHLCRGANISYQTEQLVKERIDAILFEVKGKGVVALGFDDGGNKYDTGSRK